MRKSVLRLHMMNLRSSLLWQRTFWKTFFGQLGETILLEIVLGPTHLLCRLWWCGSSTYLSAVLLTAVLRDSAARRWCQARVDASKRELSSARTMGKRCFSNVSFQTASPNRTPGTLWGCARPLWDAAALYWWGVMGSELSWTSWSLWNAAGTGTIGTFDLGKCWLPSYCSEWHGFSGQQEAWATWA